LVQYSKQLLHYCCRYSSCITWIWKNSTGCYPMCVWNVVGERTGREGAAREDSVYHSAKKKPG